MSVCLYVCMYVWMYVCLDGICVLGAYTLHGGIPDYAMQSHTQCVSFICRVCAPYWSISCYGWWLGRTTFSKTTDSIWFLYIYIYIFTLIHSIYIHNYVYIPVHILYRLYLFAWSVAFPWHQLSTRFPWRKTAPRCWSWASNSFAHGGRGPAGPDPGSTV